jgi:hypothetical protein
MAICRSAPAILLACRAPGCAAGTVPPSAPPATVPVPEQAPPPPSARAVASLAEVAGEWDVVSFGDHAPPRLGGGGLRSSYVNIGRDRLSFSIGCNHSGMPGAVRADGVLVAATPDDGIQTAMGCGPEREARDRDFFAFFRSRPRAVLLADGRLRLSGAGRTLLLERAEIRRLAFGPPLAEISGTWRVVTFLRFGNGGHQGWGAMYAPGRVTIGPSTISYSRCPSSAVRFRYTADFTLFRESPAELPPSPCAGVRPAATEVEPMLAALLGQSPHAERVPGGRYVLRSRDYAVLLATEEDYQREFGAEAAEWERRPG